MIAFIVAILIAVLGFLYLNNQNNRISSPLISSPTSTDAVKQNIEQGVSSFGSVNPLREKPNINPSDNANPLKSLKTNPFE